MAKKRATSSAKRRAAAKAPPGPPTRKLSETLIDFGGPLIARIGSDSSEETVRHIFQIIVIIWNAHVRAMRAWGHPESLNTLREIAGDDKQPELMRYAIGILAARRVRFRDDMRAVGDWEVSYNPEDGELKFSCSGLLPPPPEGEGEGEAEGEGEPEAKA